MKQKKKTAPKEMKKNEKKAAVYDAVKTGAKRGLAADALYQHVLSMVPEAGGKAIVKASLLALSDPELTDRGVLDAIYDLAIKHRLAETTAADVVDEVVVGAKKRRREKLKKQRRKQPSVF